MRRVARSTSPTIRSDPNGLAPRNLALLSAAALVAGALLGGCGSAKSARRGGGAGAERLLVVRARGCCGGRSQTAAQELETRLAKRVAVDRIEAADAPASDTELGSPSELVARALEQARSGYVGMKLGKARAALDRALRYVRTTFARGVTPAQLAMLHLYRGAIALAAGSTEQARAAFRKAAGYQQDLAPDPDIFSPVVREALQRARSSVQRTQVTVQSKPAGAQASWDGARVARQTPVTLEDQALGEHYLRLEHPLYAVWADRIRVSAQAQLRIELKPLAEQQLIAEGAKQPQLRQQASELVGRRVLWVDAEQSGQLALQLDSATGERTGYTLAADASPAAVESVAQSITRRLAQTPQSQPTTRRRASFWRRTWWLWVGIGVAAAATAITVPLVLANSSSGRDVVLPIPP